MTRKKKLVLTPETTKQKERRQARNRARRVRQGRIKRCLAPHFGAKS